jgi:hypothetical protein
MDEVGFWRLEGQADSDVEVQTSIRRGMIAFPSTRLVKISTPYMKCGILYEDFKRGFGQDDSDLLVWRASSQLMNPTITTPRLEQERRLDSVRFAREYEAEFADDINAFLSTAWVEGTIVPGRFELPPLDGVRYVAAVDPSGGGPDAFTLAIAHAEGTGSGRRIVHDVMRGWAKPRKGEVDLESIVAEIVAITKAYRVNAVHGDRYAKNWVREAFQRHGGRYVDAAIKSTYLDKSSAYLEVEPLFAQGAIEILDHQKLVRELKLLERRPTAGGRDRVDHPRGQHDDHANALAVASALARGADTSFKPLAWAFTDDWTRGSSQGVRTTMSRTGSLCAPRSVPRPSGILVAMTLLGLHRPPSGTTSTARPIGPNAGVAEGHSDAEDQTFGWLMSDNAEPFMATPEFWYIASWVLRE